MTSTAPADYTQITSQALSFDSNNLRRIVPVVITDDNIVESLEQFFASLTVNIGQYPGVTVNPDRATVIITDNDGKTKIICV